MRVGVAWFLAVAVLAAPGAGADPQDDQAERQISTYELREWNYWNNMGWRSMYEGDYVRAAARFQKAIDFARPTWKHDPPLLARSYCDLAVALLKQGRAGEAEPLAKWGLLVREAYLPEGSEAVAQARYNLAMIEIALERVDDAETHMRGSVASYEKVYGPKSRRLVPYLNDLAYLYMTRKNYDKAEPLYQRCVDLPETSLAADSPDRAASLLGLGNIRAIRGLDDQAETYYRKALDALDAESAEHPPTSTLTVPASGRSARTSTLSPARLALHADVLDNLAALFKRTQRETEAEPLEVRSKELRAQLAPMATPEPSPARR